MIGIAALALTTLVNPSATRMYSTGWREIAATAQLVPALLLLMRAFDRRAPLVLPPTPWLVLALGWTTIVVASAAFSPYRGPAFLWSAPYLSAAAVFLVAYDWLHRTAGEEKQRRFQLQRGVALFLSAVAVVSLALWLRDLPALIKGGNVFGARNPYPLGHSNYTAGIALLLLWVVVAGLQTADGPPSPGFGVASGRSTGRAWRVAAAILGLALLFTSGSRGGLIGLAALAIVSIPAFARIVGVKPRWIAIAAGLGLATLVAANPRLRSLVGGGMDVRISDVQRTSMLQAGINLGMDRPVLGWGPGTTPLAYPRFRGSVAGGPDTVLQVHSSPVELWAELGAAGALVGIFGIALLAGAALGPNREAVFALAGYAVFSLTDWQIDVPVFAFAIAAGLAMAASWVARVVPTRSSMSGLGQAAPPVVGSVALIVLTLFAIFARSDPTPELNTLALELAEQPRNKARAIAVFEESLQLNPAQEIAHFNAGWLQVVSDPVKAERHFAEAAALVPNKGGVYLGIGLSILNAGHMPKENAAFFLAVEALNDPSFLVSPLWRVPDVAALRPAANAHLAKIAGEVASSPGASAQVIAEAKYTAALAEWIGGTRTSAQMLGVAATSERVGFFSRRPPLPDFSGASAAVYRRERPGYPVLMRNLDVPVPRDVYEVQDNALATGEFGFLFPARGWVPAPLLTPYLLRYRMGTM